MIDKNKTYKNLQFLQQEKIVNNPWSETDENIKTHI